MGSALGSLGIWAGSQAVNWGAGEVLNHSRDRVQKTNTNSRLDSYSLDSTSCSCYSELFTEEMREQIQDAVIACQGIGSFKEEGTGLDDLLKSGWKVHGCSYDQLYKTINDYVKEYRDHLSQYEKQGIVGFKQRELEQRKSSARKDLTPHYCLCLVHDEKRVVMQINMGDSGTFFSQKGRDIADAIHCGQEWKEYAESKECTEGKKYSFLVTGENFGGVCAHIVAMKVGGHAVGVDMAPLDQGLLEAFELNIREIDQSNHVSLTSDPDQFNRGNSFGTILGFNTPIPDKSKMIDEVNAGNLKVFRGKVPLPPIQTTIDQPGIPSDTDRDEITRRDIKDISEKIRESSDAIKSLAGKRHLTQEQLETILDRYINELIEKLKDNTNAIESLNIRCIPEEVLKNENPLTQEQLSSIEEALSKIDQVDIPIMSDTGKLARDIFKELVSKFKGVSKEEYVQKAMTIATEVTAALYQAKRRELSQKGAQLQTGQLIKGFETQRIITDNVFNDDFINLPFLAMERIVWQTIHPSGNINRTLKESGEYLENYKEMHSDLQKMVTERKQLKGSISANKTDLDKLDASIKNKFQSMLHARDKAIKKYGKAQTGLAIVGSIFTSTASIFYPPAAPVINGAFNVAQNFVGMGATHQEKKRMKIEDKFRDYLNRTHGNRQTLANQMDQVKRENYSIEQMQNAQLHSLFHANSYTHPKEFRKQLNVEKRSLTDRITEKEKLINNKKSRIEELNQKKESCIKKINRPKKIKEEIRELENQIEEEEKKINKNLPKYASRRKKHSKEVESTELAKLMAKKHLKEKELAALSKVDNASTELKLIEINNKINEKTFEVNNLNQEIKNLKEDGEKLDRRIASEARLARTKDYFYTAITNEVSKYNRMDDETAEYQETLEEWYTLYHAARRSEREIVGATFVTFDRFFQELGTSPLFRGILDMVPFMPNNAREKIKHSPLLFQYMTKLTEQSYRIYDAYLSFKVTDDLLKVEGLEAYTFEVRYFDNIKNSVLNIPYMQEGIETLNNINFIDQHKFFEGDLKKFGALRYVKEYLLPAFEIFTSSLTFFRLASHICQGFPRTESIEEQKINGIRKFLEEHSKHLDEQFKNLKIILDKNHSEVLEQLKLMGSEITVVSSEILSEIENSKNEIIAQKQHKDSLDYTVAIKRIGEEIARNKTDLESNLKKYPNQCEEKILAYFEKIRADLKHVTAFDVNTGVNLVEGMQPTALVNIKYAQNQPDIYTGLIASKIKFEKTVSSLYLLNLTYQNYLFALNFSELYLENQSLFDTILECTALINEQAKNLSELSEQLVPIIINCRNEQNQYIESLKAPLKETAAWKWVRMQQQLEEAMKNHVETLNQLDEFVGAQKFRLGEIFCRDQIESSYRFNTYATGKQLVTDTLKTVVVTSVAMMVNPIWLVVAVTSYPFTVGDVLAQNQRIESFRKQFNQRTISSLAQSKKTEPLRVVFKFDYLNDQSLILRIWMTASGVLSSKVLLSGYETNVDVPNEDYAQSKDKTPFEADFNMQRNVHVISNNSPIKVEELEALQPSLHVRDKQQYDASLKKLQTDYQLWIKSHATNDVKKDNVFSSIHEQSRFIPSSDSNLVPLAFPKNLLKQLENRMDPDRILMEATGVGFLTPSYDFKKNENGSYKLCIQYYFNELSSSEVSLYEEFEVAYIDQNTVKAFAKPTYSVNASTAASINELLIQAMYTSFVEHLGMPGDQSVSLGGGRWIAPSERLFPGFYKLWDQYPNNAIHFNSNLFTDEMSDSLNICANGALKTAIDQVEQEHRVNIQTFLRRALSNKQGLKVGVWKKIREAKLNLSEGKSQLEENYNLLFAYCQLISSLDKTSLRQKLEYHFGILDPVNYDSFYDLIIGGLDLPPIDDTLLESFKKILDLIPSDYYKLIKRVNGNLPYIPTFILDKIDVKTQPQVNSNSMQVPASIYQRNALQSPNSTTASLEASKQLQAKISERGGLPNLGNTCWMNAALQLFAGSGTLMATRIKKQLLRNKEREKFLKELSSMNNPNFEAIKSRCLHFKISLQPKIQWRDILTQMNEQLIGMEPLCQMGRELQQFADEQLQKQEIELTKSNWLQVNSDWNEVRNRWNQAHPKKIIAPIPSSRKVEYDDSSIAQLKEDLENQIQTFVHLDKVLTLLSENTDSRNPELSTHLLQLRRYYLAYENSRSLEKNKIGNAEELDSLEWGIKLLDLIEVPAELRGTIIEGAGKVATSTDVLTVQIPVVGRNGRECSLNMLIQATNIATPHDEATPSYLSAKTNTFYIALSRTGLDENGKQVKLMHDISDINTDGKVALKTYDEVGGLENTKDFVVATAIIHIGDSIDAGHYVCVRSNDEGDYFLYDDASVIPLVREDAIRRMKKASLLQLRTIN